MKVPDFFPAVPEPTPLLLRGVGEWSRARWGSGGSSGRRQGLSWLAGQREALGTSLTLPPWFSPRKVWGFIILGKGPPAAGGGHSCLSGVVCGRTVGDLSPGMWGLAAAGTMENFGHGGTLMDGDTRLSSNKPEKRGTLWYCDVMWSGWRSGGETLVYGGNVEVQYYDAGRSIARVFVIRTRSDVKGWA